MELTVGMYYHLSKENPRMYPAAGHVAQRPEVLRLSLISSHRVLRARTPIQRSPVTDTVQETCSELLDGFAFLYQDLGPCERLSVPFCIASPGRYPDLRSCIGCPDIPKLDNNALKERGVKGAIALCCSAVCNVFCSVDGRVTRGFSLSESEFQRNVLRPAC